LIGDTYRKCKEFEVTSGKFAISIKELVKISDDHRIQLHKIEEYVDEKIAKKKELEKELEDLKNEISTLKNQKSEIENARDSALQQKKMAELEIKSYSNAKQVLDRHNISINEDLPKFANAINCIEQYGDDPRKLIAELKDIQYLDGKKRALKIAIEEFEKCIANLHQQESSLEDKIYAYSENLPVYNQLVEMGFGSSQLKTLLDNIIDIANSNGINYCLAVNKFIADVETRYDTKVGFELQIEDLKTEIQGLEKEREKEYQRVKAQPFVGPVITGLLQRGLTEHDIMKVADICHNEISNRTYSIEVLRKVVINFLQNIMMICVVNAGLYTHSKKQLVMIN
jgi:chromosome segregation ATPase